MNHLDTLLTIATDAARLVMVVYNRPFEVDFKGPNDPVTEADRQANEFICQRLHELYPGVPVVAEESDPSSFGDYRGADRSFFVDPVDGTREFVEKNGEFVVMIGMVVGQQAEVGVVVAPALNLAWGGDIHHGAFELESSGIRRAIRTSQNEIPGEARVVASRSHRTDAMQQVLSSLAVAEVRALGSAGLKGAWVASGRAEAYVSPGYAGQRWDCCATDALVTAAGGKVSDAWGDAIDYHAGLANDRGILTTNGLLHATLLEQLARSRQSGPLQQG